MSETEDVDVMQHFICNAPFSKRYSMYRTK